MRDDRKTRSLRITGAEQPVQVLTGLLAVVCCGRHWKHGRKPSRSKDHHQHDLGSHDCGSPSTIILHPQVPVGGAVIVAEYSKSTCSFQPPASPAAPMRTLCGFSSFRLLLQRWPSAAITIGCLMDSCMQVSMPSARREILNATTAREDGRQMLTGCFVQMNMMQDCRTIWSACGCSMLAVGTAKVL